MSLPNSSQQPETGANLNAKHGTGRSEPELDRLAELVANGQIPIPTDLSAGRRQRLLTEVSRRRRDRLLCHIAQAIASDIMVGEIADTENQHHAEKNL